jgi:sec-independent protein translocase protein TatA
MELGAGEIVVILAIVLLLFGPSKLPKLGEGLGSAMANFRKALRGDEPPATGAGAERGPAADARVAESARRT